MEKNERKATTVRGNRWASIVIVVRCKKKKIRNNSELVEDKKGCVHQPEIESGSSAWEAEILTTGPLVLIHTFETNSDCLY